MSTSEPLVFAEAEVVQLTWETAGLRGKPVLPSGLVATSPLLVGVLAIEATHALGSVRAVLVRLSCRSGARARALVVAGWIDGDEPLVELLCSGWAFATTRADIAIDRRYHVTTVVVGAQLELELRDPEPIHPHDVQYVVGLQPFESPDGPRLAQVDLDLDATRAERGRPVSRRFEGCEVAGITVQPVHPVAATVASGTLTLAPVRFVVDPHRPAHLGTHPR
jgi:hypothetical protein